MQFTFHFHNNSFGITEHTVALPDASPADQAALVQELTVLNGYLAHPQVHGGLDSLAPHGALLFIQIRPPQELMYFAMTNVKPYLFFSQITFDMIHNINERIAGQFEHYKDCESLEANRSAPSSTTCPCP